MSADNDAMRPLQMIRTVAADSDLYLEQRLQIIDMIAAAIPTGVGGCYVVKDPPEMLTEEFEDYFREAVTTAGTDLAALAARLAVDVDTFQWDDDFDGSDGEECRGILRTIFEELTATGGIEVTDELLRKVADRPGWSFEDANEFVGNMCGIRDDAYLTYATVLRLP